MGVGKVLEPAAHRRMALAKGRGIGVRCFRLARSTLPIFREMVLAHFRNRMPDANRGGKNRHADFVFQYPAGERAKVIRRDTPATCVIGRLPFDKRHQGLDRQCAPP